MITTVTTYQHLHDKEGGKKMKFTRTHEWPTDSRVTAKKMAHERAMGNLFGGMADEGWELASIHIREARKSAKAKAPSRVSLKAAKARCGCGPKRPTKKAKRR